MVPADARRFRVVGARLAATLESAGAELTEDGAEVEIAPARVLQGKAPTAIVSIGVPMLEGRHRVLRAARRVVGSLELVAGAARARRALRTLGYSRPLTVTWDFSQPLGLPNADERPKNLVGRLPQSALVVGNREDGLSSLYEAVVAAAKAATTGESFETPSMGAGLLLAFSDESVLRVAVGGVRRQLDVQESAEKALRAGAVPALVRDRVPELVARERLGLADWSLERRLSGKRPRPPLTEQVFSECVDFLVALHASGVQEEGEPAAAIEDATLIAELAPREAQAVLELASRIDRDLADVPRGFGHGDFHRGNLLFEGDRLVGVVDWDAAGAHRFPFLDLLHLRLSSDRVLSGQEWGSAILRHLLPWARTGGGELGRGYWSRIGFAPSTAQLERLVAAYWLVRASYELRMYSDRRERSAWMHNNVKLVLDALLARRHS